ncbi:MAG: cob(I)yrinic acid a,c-diamide adenosyltransferase [Myxococcota bacterium]
MVLLNRIYTRTGDDGTTSLVGGERVSKDDPRICAYGTVDELNATLGMARDQNVRYGHDDPARARLETLLYGIQQKLFDLGSSLATRLESRFAGQPVVVADDVTALEEAIDELNAELPPLRSFVLPGGGPVASTLHLARTVCRRAEREALHLSRLEPVSPDDLMYLNRLGDLLFVASRWIARRNGEPEPLWQR